MPSDRVPVPNRHDAGLAPDGNCYRGELKGVDIDADGDGPNRHAAVVGDRQRGLRLEGLGGLVLLDDIDEHGVGPAPNDF